MPKRYLQAVLNRVGLFDLVISMRDRVASSVRRFGDHIRLALARASSRSTKTLTRHLIAVGPDLRRRPVEALVGTDHRSSSAVRSNLELTTSILANAHVRFAVSGTEVLIAPSSRAQACAAIADAGATVYVAAGPVRPARWLGVGSGVRDQLVVFQYHAASTGTMVHGAECGCSIEFSERLPTEPAPPLDFPVDVVYTWVDSSDPAWQQRRDAVLETTDRSESHREATSAARFESLDELRYSLRSLERYADFVRHVYVVTDGQPPPAWLKADHPDLTLVPHSQILPEGVLPTFNSHAIEACLHRIPGLSEHYLYLNDDFFFSRRATKSDFFDEQGRSKSFPSMAQIPDGPVTASTRPVDAAAINVRAAVAHEFGRDVSNRKFKHAPYAQRRSVHHEIERRFPELIGQTVAARFRSKTDLAVASAMHQHVAAQLGLGVEAQMESGYVDVGMPHARERLRRLGQNPRVQVYCLNDSDHPATPTHLKAALVRAHLADVLPGPSRFERR
jgi:hypothetical protein